MGLRQTGLEFVMKGHTKFMSDLAATNKATDSLHSTFQKVGKLPLNQSDVTLVSQLSQKMRDMASSTGEVGKSGKSLRDLIPQGVLDRVKGFTDKFKGMDGLIGRLSPQLGALSSQFGGLSGQVLETVGSLNVFIVAGVAAATVLFSLGMRGAAMPGVIEAFDYASQRAGILSNVLLNDLRVASRGTVSDMALMKNANIGLAGAGDKLAQALGPGKGLAGLLNIARAQARATGQDVDFLYQSLVAGIKRGTPLLIDNTGLVLKEGEANEAYARSVGKTVEQLTAEEKQIALLNATLTAGKQAVDTYGAGALQASERIAQINTLITNTLDKAALAVQPIFNVLLEVAKTILEGIVWPLNTIVIPVFRELANTIFGPILQAFTAFKSGVGDLLEPVFSLIHRWMVVIIGIIRGVGYAFSWLVKSISNLLGPVKDIIKKYVVEPFTKMLDPVEFARRAGFIMGAFAEGLAFGANTFVLPAVIEIATLIADFLMGFSPPKKGPLSTIDKGAANVMRAWLEGFTGVSLTPVSEMAAAVAGELGAIGNLTYEQADARLKALDRQLQPYLDMLDLAKARVEAIATPLKSLQDATQRILQRQLEAFTKGMASAESVRALDSQNAQLADQLDMLQSMTDEAQYQLSLKQSQQAIERAMLQIQLKRTKPAEQIAGATEQTVAAEKAAAAGGGAGTADQTSAASGAGFTPFTSDTAGGFLGVTDAEIKQMWGDLKGGFTEGFDAAAGPEVAKLKANAGKLQTQLDRIKGTKPFKTLTDGFNSVFGDGPDSLRTKMGSFVTSFTEKWDGLWGDSGTVMGTWNTFKTNLTGAWDSLFGESGTLRSVNTETITGIFTGLFGENGEASKAVTRFETWWTGLWTYPDGGIWTSISGFSTQLSILFTVTIPGVFDNFSLEGIRTKFTEMFGDENTGLRSILNWFKIKIHTIFDPGAILESVFGNFSLQNIKDTFTNFFGEEGTGKQILDGFINILTNVFKNEKGGLVYDLLGRVGGFLATLVGAPIEGMANAVLGGLKDALNAAIRLINQAIEAYNSIPIAPDIGRMNEITGDWSISIVPKGVPAARKGGFFGPGLVNVHRGETMVSASDRYAVFPKEWVQVMSRLSNAMAPSRQAYGSAVSNVDNSRRSNTTINATFNGGANRRNFRMQLAELRGWSG